MIISLAVFILVLSLLLALVTLVQMFYLESLRLRARDLESFRFFRESLEDRLGMKLESGVLTFSLIKHSMLVLLGVLHLSTARRGYDLPAPELLEACLFSWLNMLVAAYIVPQILYRRTSCQWLTVFGPVLKALTMLFRPLTAFLGFLQSLAQLGEQTSEDEDSSSAEE
ncbi:MAG: hemolysin family protein, partial [Bryobacteraceae bacterium]